MAPLCQVSSVISLTTVQPSRGLPSIKENRSTETSMEVTVCKGSSLGATTKMD